MLTLYFLWGKSLSKKYIPLYTKYRPMIFSDITGQESTVKALSNAVTSGRIMHAYLFCGPRGTGKTSSARIFAKSLNCINGPTVEPCGQCPGCLDVINSTPVDVVEIDAASHRSVDDIRNILDKIQYAPLHGKYKIYIIDEVHMLTNEASNALLKTLEEPPENVIFILATTESHKVLETIVSRCQRYDFKRITTLDIVKRLTYIAKSENIKIDKDAIVAIAKSSAGGMRDAVALLDQLSVLGQNSTITVDIVNETLGQISYDIIYQLAECFYQNNSENALKIMNDINDKGNEPLMIITSLIQYFRDMLVLKSCSDKTLLFSMTKINEVIYEKIYEQSKNFDKNTILYIEDKLSEYFTKIKDNTNKFLWTELCIIDLTSISNVSAIIELSEKVARLEEIISKGNISDSVVFSQPTKLPKVEPPLEQPDINIAPPVQKPQEEIKNIVIEEDKNKVHSKESNVSKVGNVSDTIAIWQQLIAEIKPPAKFFFKLAKPLEINSHKIVLGFTTESAVKQASNPSKKQQLFDTACKYFDVSSVQIEFKAGNFTNNDIKQQVESLENSSNTDSEKKNINLTIKEEKKQEQIEPKQSETQKPDIVLSDNDEDERDSLYEADLDITDISDTARNIKELFNGKFVDI